MLHQFKKMIHEQNETVNKETKHTKKSNKGFPGSPMVTRICLHMQETWVPFPVGKLRSHMPQSN